MTCTLTFDMESYAVSTNKYVMFLITSLLIGVIYDIRAYYLNLRCVSVSTV